MDGLTSAEHVRVASCAQPRLIPAGALLIREGYTPEAVFVIQSGYADVVAATEQSGERRLRRVGSGEVLGEIALLTGQPASATVRAVVDLEVLAISAADFHQLAASIPLLYRNLGVLLSHRLAGANRLAVRAHGGRVTTLVQDSDAPPLLGYALACSVAWHRRCPVLLIVVSESDPHEALRALAERVPFTRAQAPTLPDRVQVILARPAGLYAPETLVETVDDLSATFPHVLVQVDPSFSTPLKTQLTVRLSSTKTAVVVGERTVTVSGWAAPGGRRPEGSMSIVRVPALALADEAALREGLLPATSAAGAALGRAARRIAGLTVGLALGAGGARGYAHLGVLRMLREIGVPIDYLAGTSVGAVVSGLYALGHGPDQAAHLMDKVGALAFRPTVPFTSLLSSARLREGLRRVGGNTRIEELPLPLALVATDMITGQEVVFRRGLLWLATLASLSIPGVMPPQRVGPYMLVDGGVVNPVPSSTVTAMGADIAIAVRLASLPVPSPFNAEAIAPGRGAPPVLHTLLRSLDLLQARVAVTATAAVRIEPIKQDAQPVGLRNFSQGRRYIPLGEAAVEAARPELAAVLPWLRP